MNKIIEIEKALEGINDAIFQEFCNHYLYLKLKPNITMPIGSVMGKEKVRKGTPDSYFTTNSGELVFAEYTTKEKLKNNKTFMSKLKADIESCFSESKTKIKKNEINQIILCFTSKIEAFEIKELEQICKKHSKTCKLIPLGVRDLSYAVLDYPILGKYLDIKVDSGQLQTPSEFIENYEKSKFSTPLSNSFYGREEELNNGLTKLKDHDIILLHGASGIGKSKFAIELCRQFCDENDNYIFLCLGNNGIPVWEDLQHYITYNKNYIILVDDANRAAKNFEWTIQLLKKKREGSIKVVATVRNYAFKNIENISQEFIYQSIEIEELEKNEISKILNSKDFDIHDPIILDRIYRISRGNIRLAIMCTKIKNLNDLNDASQIFEEYFYPIFNDFKILNENKILIAVALISFFGRINKEDRSLCDKIFQVIDENSFWESCYKLNEFELVDLFEQQIVKISDQILSTYLFYKVVIDKEVLNFNFFLDNFSDYKYRMRDTLFPVINTFNYKKIEDKIKSKIVNRWKHVACNNQRKEIFEFIDLFWFYLTSQIISFFKGIIDKGDEHFEIKNSFDYRSKKDKILEILFRYKNFEIEKFKDALELMLYYCAKNPDKTQTLISTINENLSFSRYSHREVNLKQLVVIDFFIEKSKNSKDVTLSEEILLKLIPKLLRIKYSDTEGDGRKISLYTYTLHLSDSIKEFRKKCFEFIKEKEATNKKYFLKILLAVPITEYHNSDKIFNHDKKYLFPIVNQLLDSNQLDDCFVLHELIDKLDIIKKELPDAIRVKTESKKYYRIQVLLQSRNYRNKGQNHRQIDEQNKSELLKHCSNFKPSDYSNILNDIKKIHKEFGNRTNEWRYLKSLKIILSNLTETNCELFLTLLPEIFTSFDSRVNFYYIFNSFFTYNPQRYNELFNIIQRAAPHVKICFHQTFNINKVLAEHLQVFYIDLKHTLSLLKSKYYVGDLIFIEKYSVIKSKSFVFEDIIKHLIYLIEEKGIQLTVNEAFLLKCLEIENIPLEIIMKTYLLIITYDENFDHDKMLLINLINKNNKFIVDILKTFYPDDSRYIDINEFNFEFIWELQNYKQILNLTFDYFIKNDFSYFREHPVNLFFPRTQDFNNSKQKTFIDTYFNRNTESKEVLILISNILCYSYNEHLGAFIKKILTLNSNFTIFRELYLIKKHEVYSGSLIPYIEEEKESWNTLLGLLNELPNRLDFIEHKEYVEEEINRCIAIIANETRQEFIDDFN